MHPPNLRSIKRSFYLIAFFNGFFVWYAIDKVFYEQIGMSLQQIIILGALAWAPQLLFEIPSSVLADKWSRKKVLVISLILLAASTIIIGLGSTFLVFAIGATVWALGTAMYSGTYEALIYDSLKDRGLKEHYQNVKGIADSLFLWSMTLAGIVAYLISLFGNLRMAFFFTLPGLLYAIWLVSRMFEPKITPATHANLSWYRHLKEVMVILKSDLLRWLILLVVVLVAFKSVMYEYYQIFSTSKGLSIESVALLFPVILIGMAISSYIFGRFNLTRISTVVAWIGLILSSSIGLIFGGAIAIFANLFVMYAAIKYIDSYLNLHIQERIESSRRASILSTANSFGQILFLLLAVLFYFVVEELGVSGSIAISAAPLITLGVVDIVRVTKQRPVITS